MKYLLSSGADINLRDKFGQSPLSIAIRKRECVVVECLLNAGADNNLFNDPRQSPYFIASLNRHSRSRRFHTSAQENRIRSIRRIRTFPN